MPCPGSTARPWSRGQLAVVGGVVAVKGKDQLFDGGDGGSVERGGVEFPGLHGVQHDLIEIVAEALDELLIGDFTKGADGHVDDDLLLDGGKKRAISHAGM